MTILYKGKNQDCDILGNLKKEFGVLFHPNTTVKSVIKLKESNGSNDSKSSKPKQPILQDSNTRKYLETEIGKTQS
jgi:hypothetical protein